MSFLSPAHVNPRILFLKIEFFSPYFVIDISFLSSIFLILSLLHFLFVPYVSLFHPLSYFPFNQCVLCHFKFFIIIFSLFLYDIFTFLAPSSFGVKKKFKILFKHHKVTVYFLYGEVPKLVFKLFLGFFIAIVIRLIFF